MTQRVAIVLLSAAIAAPASAQGIYDPWGSASAVGYVYDSASGLPLRRGRVCAMRKFEENVYGYRCALLGPGGYFRLDSLAAERQALTISCDRPATLPEHIGTIAVDLMTGDSVRHDAPLDTSGCDRTPEVSVTTEFRGHYTHGFEVSSFVPCGEGREAAAWVGFRPTSAGGWRWPKNPPPRRDKTEEEEQDAYPRYYVRWRGTRTGPGRYGHFGAYAFTLMVERVLEIRWPRRGDCQ